MHRSKTIFLVLATLVVLAWLTARQLAALVPLTGELPTPAGLPRNFSLYVPMRDGVDIAIDVWLPPDAAAGQRLPTLMRGTRYGRAMNVSTLYRAQVALGMASADVNLTPDIRVLNARGYVVVRVDARGSGASFGSRTLSWSEAEVEDYGEIIDWIVRQPWSNGRVGAFGVSYDGNAAEMIASTGRPALKAVAPLYSYFDPYRDLVRPGGVFNRGFITEWSRATAAMDADERCTAQSLRCWQARLLSDGAKPVDDDPDGARRAAALAQRHNVPVLPPLEAAPYRNDLYGSTGLTFDHRAPYWLRREIEASGVAMNPWVGWYDSATVDGALSRFLTFANDQELVITSFTHGGKHDTDPYADRGRPASPDLRGQYGELADFFDRHLTSDAPATATGRKVIRYTTFGRDGWRVTDTWPPAGYAPRRLRLDSGQLLRSKTDGSTPTGAEIHAVSFAETSGSATRWHTIGGPDVYYPDRGAADSSLATFTSDPVQGPLELTGQPLLTLYLASSRPDCAIHAYLEEVAPDGSVTYLTEGILRCSARTESSAAPPYDGYGPVTTFLRPDARAMQPGVVERLDIRLFALSVLIPDGHRLRLSVAGHDGAMFERIPAAGPLDLTLYHDERHPSTLELPVIAPGQVTNLTG